MLFGAGSALAGYCACLMPPPLSLVLFCFGLLVGVFFFSFLFGLVFQDRLILRNIALAVLVLIL